MLRATPMLFKPKQVQSAVRLNTFTAQEAGINSNTELTSFWNPFLFIKQSDNTLMLLRKAISYDFLATSEQHPTYSSPNKKTVWSKQCFEIQATWSLFKHCSPVCSLLVCWCVPCNSWLWTLYYRSRSNICFHFCVCATCFYIYSEYS